MRVGNETSDNGIAWMVAHSEIAGFERIPQEATRLRFTEKFPDVIGLKMLPIWNACTHKLCKITKSP